MPIKHVRAWYYKHAEHFSSISLFGGFIFDTITLQRVDTLWENFWIMLHLLICAGAILVLNRGKKNEKLDFWMVNLLQFSFGGLLSAFLIFYFRGAVLSASWPFLLILLGAFVANERLRLFERLIFQISFYFFCLFIFFIYVIPVIIGIIGPVIFLLSGFVALLVLRGFIYLLDNTTGNSLAKSHTLKISIWSIFGSLTLLYFLNIIPPLPLTLVHGGVYHNVEKAGTDYLLTKERGSWLDSWGGETIHLNMGDPIHVFTAIFSPARLNTNVVHVWERLDDERRKWVEMSRVELPIGGGREEGYRTYSFAEVSPGEWLVRVLANSGQVIGRVRFNVEIGTPQNLVIEKH